MSRAPSDSVFHDDHAGFDRPTGHSRPRTKDRPDYSRLPLGRVIAIDRGRYRCLVDDPAAPAADSWGERPVTAVKARSLGPQSVVVGDAVRLDGDVSGADGALARVAAVEPRTTVLRRMRDDDPQERPLVANADQLVVVAALADPEPRLGLIDRALVAAYDGGLEPLLCLTKADLAPADDLLTAYGPLRLAILVLQPGCDLDPLRRRLSRRCSVLMGHSGVGKSTLVNALIPGADRVIGAVNQVTGRGRHTSSSLVALALPGADGWVIDTPGVRSFGLSHVKPEHLLAAFADLAALAQDCPRGCGHRATDPECALDLAVADGRLEAARLASFRRLDLPGPLYGSNPG
ncbi:MAG: ribosome small subunit-dependent GTPase A [Propionibacteriaceae bacterium]|jgi:ribosome biogenesis GTPase|nr:ribosome small subunit-dependent GTPase A [Propionibacteriaceae bacterium]